MRRTVREIIGERIGMRYVPCEHGLAAVYDALNWRWEHADGSICERNNPT